MMCRNGRKTAIPFAACGGIATFATSNFKKTNMKALFFFFDMSPEASFLIVVFWSVVFLVLAIKDAGRKGYQKKHQHDWTQKDWQEYLKDEQKRLDEISKT